MRRWGAGLVWGVVVWGTGCGPRILSLDEGSTGEDDPMSTSGSATRTTTATAGTMGDTSPTTLDGMDDEVTTDPPPFPSFPDLGMPEPCELGQPCADPSECCSGACFTVGALGGVCSECDSDEDCGWGCNFGNPLAGIPAVCGDGGLGAGCETSSACQPGLVCNAVVELPGIIESSGCSECASDDDCLPGLLCAPSYDPGLMTGFWRCVLPGSEPNDAGCASDEVCASGQCAPASVMGVPLVSVCAECNEDVDCDEGLCVLPEVVVDGDAFGLASGFCG
ncbi:MAG: hypothetical protein KDK70_04335 [Myxococcales bacterium]|nr:hypothetical protein [Myxococcales bacterium]